MILKLHLRSVMVLTRALLLLLLATFWWVSAPARAQEPQSHCHAMTTSIEGPQQVQAQHPTPNSTHCDKFKTGSCCQPAGVAISLALPVFVPQTPEQGLGRYQSFSSFTPAGIWRPPQAI